MNWKPGDHALCTAESCASRDEVARGDFHRADGMQDRHVVLVRMLAEREIPAVLRVRGYTWWVVVAHDGKLIGEKSQAAVPEHYLRPLPPPDEKEDPLMETVRMWMHNASPKKEPVT